MSIEELGTFETNLFDDYVKDCSCWRSYLNGSPAVGIQYLKITDIEIIKKILSDYYDIEDIKWVKLHKLLPDQEILPHSDPPEGRTNAYVVHLVLKTNNKVIFHLDGIDYKLKKGRIYQIDNTKYHYVKNEGNSDRIHIMVILYGNKLVEQ